MNIAIDRPFQSSTPLQIVVVVEEVIDIPDMMLKSIELDDNPAYKMD